MTLRKIGPGTYIVQVPFGRSALTGRWRTEVERVRAARARVAADKTRGLETPAAIKALAERFR